MGEIKLQLAEQAERDAFAQMEQAAPQALAPVAAAGRSDEMSVTLAPAKARRSSSLCSKARAEFSWSVEGGVVNYDLHGDGAGNATSYQRDRGVPGHEGALEAAFDGSHGWFWRNRGTADVTITLRTNGVYSDIRRVA